MLLPERVPENDITAAELMMRMFRGGYKITFSYNWVLNKYALEVSNGKAHHVRYIPLNEASDAEIKMRLEEAIDKINMMKGENE